MQGIVLIPVLLMQLSVHLFVALLQAAGVAAAQHRRRKAIERQVREEFAPQRAAMEAGFAAEEAAYKFDLLLRAEALEAASPMRNAWPATRPWAFRRWAKMGASDVQQDAEAMAWVDATFDTAGALGRFKQWASARRSTLSGPFLETFDKAFRPADPTDVELAKRLEWAQESLSGNAQFRKLDIGADFAHPAAKMFVDRVIQVEQARDRVSRYMAEYGMSAREAAEAVAKTYEMARGPTFPKLALAA